MYVHLTKILHNNRTIKRDSTDYLEPVQQDWRNLGKVPKSERTREIYMLVVKQNGLLLQHVEEQTPEICMVAVQ